MRAAATAGMALTVVGGRRTRAAATQGENDVCVALLADTHIPADPAESYRGFRPCESLAAAVPEIVAARPTAVILCGDAARLEGRPEDYRELAALWRPVAEVAPIHVALGNHDDRAAFLKVMSPTDGVEPPVAGKHVILLERPCVRIVLLDSLMFPNKTPGLLGQAQRAWLANRLPAFADRPTVLCVHHTLGDRDGDLLDTDRLLSLLRPHRHVKAIFCGHAHIWRRDAIDGLPVVNLPALGYNFNDREPVGWTEARFHPGGVDLTVHPLAGRAGAGRLTDSLQWGG